MIDLAEMSIFKSVQKFESIFVNHTSVGTFQW